MSISWPVRALLLVLSLGSHALPLRESQDDRVGIKDGLHPHGTFNETKSTTEEGGSRRESGGVCTKEHLRVTSLDPTSSGGGILPCETGPRKCEAGLPISAGDMYPGGRSKSWSCDDCFTQGLDRAGQSWRFMTKDDGKSSDIVPRNA